MSMKEMGSYINAFGHLSAIEKAALCKPWECGRGMDVNVKQILVIQWIGGAGINPTMLTYLADVCGVAALLSQDIYREKPCCILEPQCPCGLVPQLPPGQEEQRHLHENYYDNPALLLWSTRIGPKLFIPGTQSN